MPNCERCGVEIGEDARECAHCAPVSLVPPTPVYVDPAAAPRVSKLAVATFVLGLLSVPTSGLLSLPGLLLGWMALKRINREKDHLRGYGLALTGNILAAVMIVPGLIALFFPVYMRSKEKSPTNTCLYNQRQLALAFSIYMADNKEMYPPANSDWATIVLPYAGGDARLFQCPSAGRWGGSGVADYGANIGVLGKHVSVITYPDRTILTGDGTASDFLLRGTADLDLARHKSVGVVGYVDGHVETLSTLPAALGP